MSTVSGSGSSDTPNPRWKVRLARRQDGSLYPHIRVWDVFEPNGDWSGTLETWPEAMEWATSVGARFEYWLQHQPPQRTGYFGQPDNRDDEGHLR